MTIPAIYKHSFAAFLIVGFAAACASSPEPEEDECEGISDEVQAEVDDARAVVQEARDMGADWRGARRMTNQAEAAGEDCRDEEAMQLAAEAEEMAQDAMDRYEEEQAAAEEEAEADASSEEEEPEMGSYTVNQGDSLWTISGMGSIYDDPYQWPLIYRANTDRIDDADLIYPDQELRIERDPSDSAVDAAVDHARNRGEWSIGEVEESDREYLDDNGM